MVLDPSLLVTIAALLVTIAVNLVVCGVSFGALNQRVKELRRDVDKLDGVSEALVRLEERAKSTNEKLSELTSSWLFKSPPGYDSVPAARARARSSPPS